MSGRVLVHPDPDVLAAHVAARAVVVLADALHARGTAHLVLTGGSTGNAVLAAIGSSPAAGAVDWSAVHVWWGDERFVAVGADDRNETTAREVLLDRHPFDPEKVHPIPAPGGKHGSDVETAARAYADTLRVAAGATATGRAAVPAFDVLLLGVGPDGHVASLFPGARTLDDPRSVVAVEGSPKPPPTRVSLGFTALRAARHVWFVVDGDGKAEAVARGVRGAPLQEVPAAHVSGTEDTVWFLDRGAASGLG